MFEMDFKFFKENEDKRPKTRNEVRKIVLDAYPLIYNDTFNFEVRVETFVDIICDKLEIRD